MTDSWVISFVVSNNKVNPNMEWAVLLLNAAALVLSFRGLFCFAKAQATPRYTDIKPPSGSRPATLNLNISSANKVTRLVAPVRQAPPPV